MNSRIAIGARALLLKANHGFALGVREMQLFKLNPLGYAGLRRKANLKLTRDIVLGQAFHKLLLQGPESIHVSHEADNVWGYKPLTDFSPDETSHVTPADMWRLERMHHNFQQNREIQQLLLHSQTYKGCGGLFIEGNTGCECYFSADFIIPAKGCVVDVKTCPDISDAGVALEMERWQYHWQAWWAATGASLSFEKPLNEFIFVFVGQNAPFEIKVCRASASMLRLAADELMPFISLYEEYFEAGAFYARPQAGR